MLFLALTQANQFKSLGASAIHNTFGYLDVHYNGKFKSGLDVDDFKLGYGKNHWRYALGYTIAHEFVHQLDAFSLMSSEGNLKKRGYRGHYGGKSENNLLMDGQYFQPSNHKKGGTHELLLPNVRERIHKYLAE
mgnify:CR=1 FL=1